jgi:sulfite exporter TauE/SafE
LPSGVAWLLVPFFGGLTGALHWVGMCSVFPVALRRADRPALRQLLYNLGRLNTLALIGAASGTLGAAVVGSGPFRLGARWLAFVTGALMVVVGLELLGVTRDLPSDRNEARFSSREHSGTALAWAEAR